jgi:lipid II:glycine glycyltransferase (peptidoglycan interpeptide bridge formation enzyme)
VSRKKEISRLFAGAAKKFGLMLFYDFTPQVIDMQPFLWDGFETRVNFTYFLDISDLNKVDSNMDHRIRNNIRQAVKSGYEIMWGFEDNINTFLDLNKMTFKRQNLKRYDHNIIQKLLTAASRNKACNIGVVVDADREPLASIAIVWDTKRVYSICGGINHKSHSAMSFLIWETFRYAGEVLNIKEFDFEGSAIPSIERYFRKFGGNIVPHYGLLSRFSTTAKWVKQMFY